MSDIWLRIESFEKVKVKILLHDYLIIKNFDWKNENGKPGVKIFKELGMEIKLYL